MAVLKDAKIVLGVTGCIAAYKAAELVRQLVKQGAEVDVIMTHSATQFLAPLSLQTLSGNPVTTELFSLFDEKHIGHISLARRANVLAIAPATANIIGKAAGGIADDMLSTVIIATGAPVLFAPAMNDAMWKNPVVQRNVARLKELGHHFVGPGTGDLACGSQGPGRLAETQDVVDEIAALLLPNDFAGKRVIVTAGPTREYLDPVRFISNPSSGKTGYAFARAFQQRGARVTLISGPVSLRPPRHVEFVPVMSARDMAEAVQHHFDEADVVIKSAAVADYRPRDASQNKIKKKSALLALELEKTEDILEGLGRKKGHRILVGFAAETQRLRAYGKQKLTSKNLDMVIINDVGRQDIGFGAAKNQVTVMTADGATQELPRMDKEDLAHVLLDRIRCLMNATGE